MASLADQYLQGRSDLSAYFTAHPTAIDETPLPAPDWHDGLREAIAAYNKRLCVPKEIPDDAAVVVTGQQAAIFGGPIYTVLKAMTAIKLADRLQRMHDRPVAPVFWLAGDDHDFEEAREVCVMDKRDAVQPLRYEPSADPGGAPLHAIPMDGNIADLIDAAAKQTRGSEFREPVHTMLRETLGESDSLCDWAARILAQLFRDTPLVMFAPHIHEARVAAKPIIAAEIDRPLASTGRVNAAGEALRSAGLEPQVVKADNEVNFFVMSGTARCKVVYEDNRFVLPDTGERFDADDLRMILDNDPDRFSPNVITRPVVQQHIFPCAAYVGGPGEIAYWAQLRDVFGDFGETMPIVYPRTRVQLTTNKITKLRERYALSPNDLGQPYGDLRARMLREVIADGPALQAVENSRADLQSRMNALVTDLKAHDVTAADQAAHAIERMTKELDRIASTIAHNDEARVATVEQHLARLQAWYAPNGKPQDRVYTIFSFLFEYGWDLIPRILDAIREDDFQVQEIEL